MRYFLLKTLPALAAALLLHIAAYAQGAPGNGGTTGGPAAPTTPTSVPLDGGASLLLAGGVAYGIKRLRQRRKPA